MSLLGGMLAGAATGGAQAVTDIANMTLEDRRTKALEQMRLDNTMMLDETRYARDLARDDTQYNRRLSEREEDRAWALEDWDRKAAHDKQIAGMRSSGTGTARLDPRVDLINKDLDRLAKQLEDPMIPDEQKMSLRQQMDGLLQVRNQLAGLDFGNGGASNTNPLIADLANGGGIVDPSKMDAEAEESGQGLLQRVLSSAPQNQRTQQRINSTLEGVDPENPVALTDATLQIQNDLRSRDFGERRMDSALATGESRANARQSSIPQSQREIAEFQSKYLNDQVQITREEAIQIYPLITSPVVRDKLKRDFSL